MKSIFLLCGALCAVSDASECQADENSLLQARSVVRTTKSTGSNDATDLLKNMRHVANSLLEGSDTTVTADEVNDALEAASDALAALSPAIRQQIETAQEQINDAAAAVQVCHGQALAAQRSSLGESLSQRSAAVESCQDTLGHFQADETRQCDIAEDCLCDEARERTTAQEALCVALTETYEVAFCEHHQMCTLFRQCHAQEAEVYQRQRADVEAEMALIVQEYIAVEQSRCLTGLIMQSMTPPRTPISHAALIACDDVDVSALQLDFPALPAEPAACPAHAHGDPDCTGFPNPAVIRNAHNGRRLFAQSNRHHEDGFGAANGGTVFDDQKWIIEDAGDGAYTIRNFHSGRRIFAQGNKAGYDGVGAANGGTTYADQKWFVELQDNHQYIIRNYHSGRRLFAQAGRNHEDGVGAGTGTVYADQMWFIEAA